MKKGRGFTLLFVALIIYWLLFTGSFAPDILVVGIVSAFIIALIFRSGLSFLSGLNTTPRGLGTAVLYVLYFFKELVKSNLQLAAIVLSPSLPVRPGIVKVRTRLKSPVGRLLLANSISLTPGTLTVELREEWLYIHWVTVESTDIDAATANIVHRFERYLEVMYG